MSEREEQIVEMIARALYEDFRIESEMTGEGCTSFDDHARLHPEMNEPYWEAAKAALTASRSAILEEAAKVFEQADHEYWTSGEAAAAISSLSTQGERR